MDRAAVLFPPERVRSSSEGAAGVSEAIDQLTAAMAAGDEAAVERFYRRYFERLYAHARRATRRDEAFCLDVVQEAMLRVIRLVRKVESTTQFETWLRLVVQTCAYDLLRNERRRALRETVAAGSRHESSHDPDRAADAEQLAWLRRQIQQLDPQIVQMIELRFEHRWTLSRIGRLLGLSPGTVDGRLRRAIRRLRDLAQEEFDG